MRCTCWKLKGFCLAVFCESLRVSAKPQVTRETLYLISKVCFFSFLYPHYPQNCKESLIEKTLVKHLRVRRLYTQNHLHISLSFPLLLPLHLQVFEWFLAQTFSSPNLRVVRSFLPLQLGSIGRSQGWWMQFGAKLRDPDN